MNTAIPPRVLCGQTFSDSLRLHLQELAAQQPPPFRNALARELCAQLNWRSPNGRPAVSSAKVALRKLERRLLLTRPAKRSGPRPPHRLRRSGPPLPPLGRVPRRVEPLQDLHLHLLSGADDPLHSVWNDLIIQQHPCGAAPLVGPQLRSLIGSEQGGLGALGFGPAAWVLGARDQWIGWSVAARTRTLPHALGLSRLLIRIEVPCANLASKVLALVLARWPADGEQRYGLRPLLAETFVDPQHFTGRCFTAANWRCLGASQGRGRLGPATPTKTPKDIDV
jgi:hypothetical protein